MPNEGQKLDNLRPGSREMEKCRWEGHNFQLLKEVQCLKKKEEEEEEEEKKQKKMMIYLFIYLFNCGLRGDSVTSSDYMALNIGMFCK